MDYNEKYLEDDFAVPTKIYLAFILLFFTLYLFYN
jgi:hypothetical protein